MGKYAENTQVPSDRSRGEIEKTLVRYGASAFCYGGEDEKAIVGFQACGRHVRFNLPLPDREDFSKTETGRDRSPTQQEAEYEKAVRQRWRALALAVKAKLECVETGITTFEEEFLAHILLPDGKTVGSWISPQLEKAYDKGSMPKLLPGL